MEINSTIFRLYDIRGSSLLDINTTIAYKIGFCFTKLSISKQGNKILIGRDGRLSSPALYHALVNGIISAGGQAISIGVAPSPMLYFADKIFKPQASIMITGSHNPKDDNGFKMLSQGKSFFDQQIQHLLNSSLVSNGVDKANIIANEYDKIHRQNREMGDKEFDKVVMSEINSFSLMTASTLFQPLLTDADEIRHILKNLKSKKSNGPDNIPNVVLKKLPSSAHEFLAKLINHILSIGYYPYLWKEAHVIPIPKPGKPANEAKNFRPISLLNSLSKVLEKVLHARILNYCNEKNLLPDNQFGFRSKHSTVHALIRLIEEAVMGFNDRKITIAAFLDIEKAFDTMWVEGLIYKLIKNGIS